MVTMTTTPAAVSVSSPVPARSSWHSPRSYGGTLVLFVLGYILWQPFAAAVLPRLTGGPRIEGPEGWQVFLMLLPVLGVIGGSLWWLGAERKPGWIRNWLRSAARMLALSTMLMAARIGGVPISLWLAVTLGTAAIMGLLFGWMERWDTAASHHRPPA